GCSVGVTAMRMTARINPIKTMQRRAVIKLTRVAVRCCCLKIARGFGTTVGAGTEIGSGDGIDSLINV
ncbi:MAG: hypothetical protein ABF379_07180, partial [Akkermansiaceae bacterium]